MSYATIDQYLTQTGKSDIQKTDVGEINGVQESLDAAEDHVNNFCNRDFRQHDGETRVFVSMYGLESVIDDFRSLTKVEQSSDLKSWSNIEFQVVPQTRYGFPNTRIRFDLQPRQYLRCTGDFGWDKVPNVIVQAEIRIAALQRGEGRFATGTRSRGNTSSRMTRNANEIMEEMLDEYVRKFI